MHIYAVKSYVKQLRQRCRLALLSEIVACMHVIRERERVFVCVCVCVCVCY